MKNFAGAAFAQIKDEEGVPALNRTPIKIPPSSEQSLPACMVGTGWQRFLSSFEGDSSSDFIQVGWRESLHLCLQISPQEKIQRRKVGGTRGPFNILMKRDNAISEKLG